ncbi:MAG: hypothetical protein LBU66_09125 [Treponema sp.]|jgi:transposase-like protein|nr:hypothetical protein [Treponema sp.]
MEKLTLNELYLQYTRGEIKRAKFEGLIYKYYFINKEKTSLSHWRQEAYEDYISWFYPRLRKAIDSYNEVGSSFEAFMTKFILISSREYRVRVTTNNVIEYSTWSARLPDLYDYSHSHGYNSSYANENPPEYLSDNTQNTLSRLISGQTGRRNTRRVLALLLKCYNCLSDDFIEKIAPLIKVDDRELKKMLNNIRKIRQKKDDEIYHMKERIYCQYYRCIAYENRLSLLRENIGAYNKLKLRLERARRRLKKMRDRLALVRTEASNRQVAQVIGISKGTVDSSLFKLKEKMENLAKEPTLN